MSIGALVLNRVPTDVLTGSRREHRSSSNAALFPFNITFDPASRLIAFEPTEHTAARKNFFF